MEPRSLRNRAETSIARRMLTLPEPIVRTMLKGPLRKERNVELDPVSALCLQLASVSSYPALETLAPIDARRAYRAMLRTTDLLPEPMAAVEERTLTGHTGPLATRIYRPTINPAPAPALLYLHGGGFVIGDLDTHDAPCRALAKASGAVVINATYRLAPEHRFPSAVEDACALLESVFENAEKLGLNPKAIAIGGDSAGGNLAAVAVQLAKKHGRRLPALQVLIYPALDMRGSTASRRALGDGLLLTDELISYFHKNYIDLADVSDMRASPLVEEELAGLSPAIISTAGFDPLRDDGEAYAERLQAARVPVVRLASPSLLHGFISMAGVSRPAHRALLAIGREIGRELSLRRS